MQRIFFIGDIHGCNLTFRKMVHDIIGLRKEDVLYCVGDYIDRGPDSKGVVDFILHLQEHEYQVYTIRGNHEQMLLEAGDNVNNSRLWMLNGGGVTLDSFGVRSVGELPVHYYDFFRKTKYFIETDDFLVVHAGFNFQAPDTLKDKESMLWIRNFDVDSGFLNGRLLIHGHTPISKKDILSKGLKEVVNIDGGCVYKHRIGMGNLVALNYTEKQFLFAPNIDE